MNKHGIALVFAFLVLLVLFILLSSFFLKSINENNLVKRYVNSTRAFWAAEAGIAEAKTNLLGGWIYNTVGGASYEVSPRTLRATINNCEYYDLASTGIVRLPSGGEVRRTLNAVVKTGPIDDTKFPYAINAANDLCFGGGCSKDPYKYISPGAGECSGHACYKESDTTINFQDLFGATQSYVQSIATQYTTSNFPNNVSGISWVDVPSGDTLTVAGDLTGTGLLIINGNVHFAGTYEFRGIVYVLGTLTATGTFDSYGSMIVASTVGVDTINGAPVLHWDQNEIHSALLELAERNTTIVSWKEAQ